MAKNNTAEEMNGNENENNVQVGGSEVQSAGVGVSQTVKPAVAEKSDVEYIAGIRNLRDVPMELLESYDASIARNAEVIEFNKGAMSPETKAKLEKLQMKYGVLRPKINVSKSIGGVRVSVMPGNRPIMKQQENGYQASVPDWNIPFKLYITTEGMHKGIIIPGRDAINVMNVLNMFFKEHRDIMEFGAAFAIDIENAESALKKTLDAF